MGKIAKIKNNIIIIVVGLAFCAGGLLFILQPDTERIKTEAKIVSIEVSYDSFNERNDYEVWVSFEAQDGETYVAQLDSYSSGMKEGNTTTIMYDPNNPEDVTTPAAKIMPIIFLVAGAAILAFAIIRIIKSSKEQGNILDRVNMSNVSEEQIRQTQNNTEPVKEYYFHYVTGQGLKQGYILETPERKPVFEAVPQNVAILSKYKFDFINHLTGTTVQREVTHTVSESHGDEYTTVMTDSNFKIDGVNCWTALGNMGYAIQPYMNNFHITYDIRKYGVNVASMEAAGTNIATGKDYTLGNIDARGIFTIRCRESDVEGVFLACFILSRTFD